MTALLWVRPIFAVILLALVGLYVWTGWRAEAAERDGPRRATGQNGQYRSCPARLKDQSAR